MMTRSRQLLISIFVLSVFVSGLYHGLSIAMKKPLWNDEIYSQTASVESHAWPTIVSGHVGEGNNSPIFYLVQKIICKITGYQSNELWNKDDERARFILRIAPVFCMSLGMALIVWFFCVYYSLLGGVIAFIVAISSYMVWYYRAEARPYALIFLAAAVQTLTMLYYCRSDRKLRYGSMAAANLFAAFTFSLSIIQIVASGFILWLKGYRRIWPLLWSIALPFGIAFGYYILAEHYSFYFASRGLPLALIRANIPAGRLGAFFIFPILIWAWDLYINKKKEFILWSFFVWAWLTFMGYVAFLGYLEFLTLFQKSAQFEVSNRYLMALTPLGVITVSAAILEMVKRPHLIWVRIIAWITVLAVILPRLVKVYRWMSSGL